MSGILLHNKRKRILLCFTGIDGAGKTTLAKHLTEALNQRGLKFHYVYSRFRPIISAPFLALGRSMLLHNKDIFKDYKGYTQSRAKLFRRRLPRALFQNLLLFDQFLQIMFKVKIPLMLGRNIVCDRYVYDTIITDIMPVVDLYCPSGKIVEIIKRYASLLPKPDFTFLADVPEEIAFSRKTDVPSIDYLKERRQTYLDVGRRLGMTILDGTKQLEQLKSEIEEHIFQETESMSTE